MRTGAKRLTCTGMHKTYPFRDFTVLSAAMDTPPANAICYRPLTAQLGQMYKD